MAGEGDDAPAPAEVGLTPQAWVAQKEAVAMIWCEQKWADLIVSMPASDAAPFASGRRKVRLG